MVSKVAALLPTAVEAVEALAARVDTAPTPAVAVAVLLVKAGIPLTAAITLAVMADQEFLVRVVKVLLTTTATPLTVAVLVLPLVMGKVE